MLKQNFVFNRSQQKKGLELKKTLKDSYSRNRQRKIACNAVDSLLIKEKES